MAVLAVAVAVVCGQVWMWVWVWSGGASWWRLGYWGSRVRAVAVVWCARRARVLSVGASGWTLTLTRGIVGLWSQGRTQGIFTYSRVPLRAHACGRMLGPVYPRGLCSASS